MFYRDNPEDCGLQPDGMTDAEAEAPAEGRKNSFTLPQARRTFTFWVFNLALAMNALYFTALTFHVASIFEQVGRSESVAFSIFLPKSIVGVCLGFAAGWISDYINLKYLLTVLTGGMIISMVGVLLLSTSEGYVMVIAGTGIAQGTFGLLMAVTWPISSAGRIWGLSRASCVAGRCFSARQDRLCSACPWITWGVTGPAWGCVWRSPPFSLCAVSGPINHPTPRITGRRQNRM